VTPDIYDVTIIGGGPTGLFAAYYSGARRLRTKVLDSLNQLGGQISAFYPEKYIYDVAGFPKILGKDLVAGLKEQAEQYHPCICLGEKVLEIRSLGAEGIRIVTDRGEHWSKIVIMTVGFGMFTPKKVAIPGAERFEGKGLSYFVRTPETYHQERVLIVGGGNSAVDWALNLSTIGRSVTLIHRRAEFRAFEDSVQKLFSSSVKIKVFYELKEILGEDRVTGAIVVNNKTGQEERLDVESILCFLGFEADWGPLKRWNLELDGRSVKVNSKMETNIPGIYAAGDLVSYPGKVRLISTAFGEAATAVNNAVAHINPQSALFPGHSSEKKKEQEIR